MVFTSSWGGQEESGEGAVVAIFASAARDDRQIDIHGDGTQSGDFLHVADLVDGLLRMGAAPADGI